MFDLKMTTFTKGLAKAQNLFDNGHHMNALSSIKELSLGVEDDDEDKESVDYLEGSILGDLAENASDDLKFTYLLGSAICFSRIENFQAYAAQAFFDISIGFGSSFYRDESVKTARKRLGLFQLTEEEEEEETLLGFKADMEYIIREANSIVCKPMVASPLPLVEKLEEHVTYVDQGLKLFWDSLSPDLKKNLLRISIPELKTYVHLYVNDTTRQDTLIQVLTYAKKKLHWVVWLCRSCSQRFSTKDECKLHIEETHEVGFKSSIMPRMITDEWAHKISLGSWDPIDARAAMCLINKAYVFEYNQGWCKEWPLADDQERSSLLQEIKSQLMSLYKHRVFSASILDLVIKFGTKDLQVFRESTTCSRLLKTPQCLCFLKTSQLTKIIEFLRKIECQRDDGTNLICRAVRGFSNATSFKERIDFDSNFAYLLLDKRLLHSEVHHIDRVGKIGFFDPKVHFASARVRGDSFLTWVCDNYARSDRGFKFPTPSCMHNLDIWLAVLKIVQYTRKTLQSQYEKKLRLLEYQAALCIAEELCLLFNERMMRESYLWDMCKDSSGDLRSVVCDIFSGGGPCLTQPELEDARTNRSFRKDKVLMSVERLKLVLEEQLAIIDAKLLLIELSRSQQLEHLSDIAFFDYRHYIRSLIQDFLLHAR